MRATASYCMENDWRHPNMVTTRALIDIISITTDTIISVGENDISVYEANVQQRIDSIANMWRATGRTVYTQSQPRIARQRHAATPTPWRGVNKLNISASQSLQQPYQDGIAINVICSREFDGVWYVVGDKLVRSIEQARTISIVPVTLRQVAEKPSATANVKAIRSQLSRARMQRNKHLIADLEKQLEKML